MDHSSSSYQPPDSHSHPQQHNDLNNLNNNLSHPPQHPYDGLPPQHDDQQQQQQLAAGGRFTEEWDATQRGSSIIEGTRGINSHASANSNSAAANMQRSNSAHSYAAGDDTNLGQAQALPSRSNTLKKKNSIRRAGNGSVRRSGSRRSMRAGSVKSLALQSSSDPDEANSVFFCPIPTTGNPTDVLCNRFQSASAPVPIRLLQSRS